MAQDKNNRYIKEKKTDKKETKKYKNPTTSLWGKIIIITLAILMLFAGLTALIFRIAGF